MGNDKIDAISEKIWSLRSGDEVLAVKVEYPASCPDTAKSGDINGETVTLGVEKQ